MIVARPGALRHLLRRNNFARVQESGVYGRYVTELQPPADPALADAGWSRLDIPDAPGGFDDGFAPLLVRASGPGRAEALIETGRRSCNVMRGLHGGFLAAMAEKTLFLPLFVAGRIGQGGVVTIDFSLQYLIGGDTEKPLLARVELLRETGRMAFVRGELTQDGEALVAYAGTLRKLPKKDA